MQPFHTYTFSPSQRVHAIFDQRHATRSSQPSAPTQRAPRSALASRVRAVRPRDSTRLTPMMRMDHCRQALERLDNNGWKRSYHQRLFHDDFLVHFCIVLFTLCTDLSSMPFAAHQFQNQCQACIFPDTDDTFLRP